MMVRRLAGWMAVLPLAAMLTSCAGMQDNMQGPLQPQSIAGSCDVKRFFLLGTRSVPVEMTVSPGGACTFTLINPALNAVINAALVTGVAQHGRAQAAVVNGARQVAVSYQPAPGFVGSDRFEVTLEPGAVGLTVQVTVQPGR